MIEKNCESTIIQASCTGRLFFMQQENLPLRKREYGKAGREIENNKNYLLRHYVTPPLNKAEEF